MATRDLSISKPGVGAILWALLVLFVAVLIAMAVLHLFRGGSPHDAERVNVRYDNLAAMKKANAAKLKEYAWINKAKGTVQLPVEDALRIMTRELADKKPVSAYPIATPAPAAATPAPGAATPAPSAAPPAAAPAPSPTPIVAPPTATPVSAVTPSASEGTALEPPPATTPDHMP